MFETINDKKVKTKEEILNRLVFLNNHYKTYDEKKTVSAGLSKERTERFIDVYVSENGETPSLFGQIQLGSLVKVFEIDQKIIKEEILELEAKLKKLL